MRCAGLRTSTDKPYLLQTTKKLASRTDISRKKNKKLPKTVHNLSEHLLNKYHQGLIAHIKLKQ